MNGASVVYRLYVSAYSLLCSHGGLLIFPNAISRSRAPYITPAQLYLAKPIGVVDRVDKSLCFQCKSRSRSESWSIRHTFSSRELESGLCGGCLEMDTSGWIVELGVRFERFFTSIM